MRQVLTFLLGRERYGLDIVAVQEIVEAPQRYFIPSAPACFQGAINFHGTILPVIDLGRLLGFELTGCDERVIVLDAEIGCLALAVSLLEGIVALPGDDLLPGDPERQRQACISELLYDQDEMINMLDIHLLLTRLETR